MKTIYKYLFKTTDRQLIELPKGFEILTIQTQSGIPCLWILADFKSKELESVEIETFGTGHDVYHINGKTERKYIGTYQLNDGKFIGHVFQRIR